MNIPKHITPEWLEARSIPEPNTGCWLWTKHLNIHGYGRVFVRLNGKSTERGAHRIMYLLTHGPVPPGHVVMHRCDVRSCINPAHLTHGTSADNSRDMTTKGRQSKGDRHPHARLTAHHAEVIRKLTDWRVLPQTAIAELFGVCGATVNHIHTRRLWRPS